MSAFACRRSDTRKPAHEARRKLSETSKGVSVSTGAALQRKLGNQAVMRLLRVQPAMAVSRDDNSRTPDQNSRTHSDYNGKLSSDTGQSERSHLKDEASAAGGSAGDSKSISAVLKYIPETKSDYLELAPGEFGLTQSNFGFYRTLVEKDDRYEVTGNVKHLITWYVRSGAGPKNKKDIASENDANISRNNYLLVVSDLTPNMAVLGGQPPRLNFWARDLTKRHELVHVRDKADAGKKATADAEQWLSRQKAIDIDELKAVVDEAFEKVRSSYGTQPLVDKVAGEKHAYSEGAPAYKQRADAISAKGSRGDYK